MKRIIMDFSFYVITVTLAAFVYSFIVREIQYRIGNQKEMQKFQEENKKLNEELKKATERKDSKKVEELTKKQMEAFPQMGKMMVGQFKTLAIVLGVFFAFTWGINYFDPTVKDDLNLQLLDDGKSCDGSAGDGVYGACFTPINEGPWVAHLKAFENGNLIAENYTSFLVGNGNIAEAFTKQGKGEIQASIEKSNATPGELNGITAKSAKANKFEAVLNNGTWFYVDLPFTIPILNIKRINEVYWWFIFVTIISGLVISFIMGKIRKAGETKVVG